MINSVRRSRKVRNVAGGIFALLLSGSLAVASAQAVDRLEIKFGPANDLLPYDLVQLRRADYGASKLPIHNHVQVYRPQRLESDSAYIIHASNSDIFNNDPAVFSFNNATYPEIIDHDPVYANLTCFKLLYDERAGATVIFAGGYRHDSTFVLKSFPGSNEFEYLHLATGRDLTGDDQWRGVLSLGNPVDYDFDGRLEMFCYVDPGRDLRPRLLFCIEPSTMTLEWSLPVASVVCLDQLYACGDTASPAVVFSTYNYRNGVEDANFSDLYGYLVKVDGQGRVLDRRVLTEEHGSSGLWQGASGNTYFLFHGLPLVAPDSMREGREHHYQLSKIDRDFRTIESVDLDKRIRQAWLADYRGDGIEDLYVLFHGGEVRIYDTTLNLLALSEETGILNFVDTLLIGENLSKAYVFNTADGTALYTHDFEWLGQLDAPVWICYPLKYGPSGQVQQFIISGQTGYGIVSVNPRSFWELAKNLFYNYQVYILAVFLILLLLVVWSNVRRLRAQRQLLVTRDRLRSVIENVHDVVYRTDTEGRLVWVTPSGARLLGYDGVEDLIGKPLKGLYGRPEEREKLLEELEAHGSVRDYEVMLRHRNGSTVTVSTSSSLWRDGAGNVIGVEGVVRDITLRKDAERALRASEEKYRHLFDCAQVGMFRASMNGSRVLAANKKMLEIFGGTAEEIMASQPLSRWADPTARRYFVEELLSKGEVSDYEITALDKDGREQLVLLSARYYSEQDYMEGTVVDITEGQQARQALRESEERYHTLAESSPDGIMAADPANLKIVFVNRAMTALSGYTSEELLTLRFGDLSDESGRERTLQAANEIVRGRANNITNMYLVRKNGSTVTVDIRAVQEKLDGRTVILCFVRDVTDLRQTELLLRQRTASLKRLSDRLIDLQENDRKFIARELHDTVAQNLALSKIKLETAILTSPGVSNGAIKEASAQVTEAIHYLKHISAELRPQMLDELGLGPTIEWYLNNYAQGIKVRFETRGTPYPLESKKQINLFRVFQELMLNMKKHSGADRISVVLEYSSSHVTMTVEDNGRGFDLGRVTDNWVASSTFGLINITERVEIVGGEFTINTGEGQGATFIITIPGK